MLYGTSVQLSEEGHKQKCYPRGAGDRIRGDFTKHKKESYESHKQAMNNWLNSKIFGEENDRIYNILHIHWTSYSV